MEMLFPNLGGKSSEWGTVQDPEFSLNGYCGQGSVGDNQLTDFTKC